MSEKIKAFFESAKDKTDTRIVQMRTETNEAIAVLKDNSGGNHTTEVIMGCVIAVVIGCLLLQTFTGFFTNTFWPLISGKITGIFK